MKSVTSTCVVVVCLMVLAGVVGTSLAAQHVDFWDMPDEGIIPDGTGRGYGTLPSGDRYVKGEVWVVFEEGSLAVVDSVWKASHSGSARTGIGSFENPGATYHLESIRASTGPTYVGDPHAFVRRHYLLVFPKETDLADLMEIVEAYRRLPYIEDACINIVCRTLAAPNDPLFSAQWAHDSSHLQSESAWNITKGSSSVAIGIVDTGLDWEHPDLEESLWINSAEDINSNGKFDKGAPPQGDENEVGDDGNGKKDDVIGWDFYSNDNDPQHTTGGNRSHGTKVAGIAAATTNNTAGVAGLAGGWYPQAGCKLMALRAGQMALVLAWRKRKTQLTMHARKGPRS